MTFRRMRRFIEYDIWSKLRRKTIGRMEFSSKIRRIFVELLSKKLNESNCFYPNQRFLHLSD